MNAERRSLNSEQRSLGWKSIGSPRWWQWPWGRQAVGSSPMTQAGAGRDGERASYRAAGVDYETLDAGKRLAMAEALSTSTLLAARGGRALDASRGEPAFVFELDGRALAFVVEGLGTKSMIARQVLERQGINR